MIYTDVRILLTAQHDRIQLDRNAGGHDDRGKMRNGLTPAELTMWRHCTWLQGARYTQSVTELSLAGLISINQSSISRHRTVNDSHDLKSQTDRE